MAAALKILVSLISISVLVIAVLLYRGGELLGCAFTMSISDSSVGQKQAGAQTSNEGPINGSHHVDQQPEGSFVVHTAPNLACSRPLPPAFSSTFIAAINAWFAFIALAESWALPRSTSANNFLVCTNIRLFICFSLAAHQYPATTPGRQSGSAALFRTLIAQT
jgi:hypothetical protein